MTAIFTGDLHLTDNPRDAYRFQHVKRVVELAKKRGADQLIIGGDLTEEKDNHSAGLTNAIADIIADAASAMHVIVYRGNHDYKSIASPFFKFIRHFKNVTFIEKPRVETIGHLGRCLFLPHTRDHKRDWLLKMLKADYAYIFAHNTFEGSVVGNTTMGSIPTTIFPKDARVISGDVHIPHRNGPITYVGAPYTIDFGDDYEGRVLELSNKGMRSIPIEGPQKRLVDISSIDDLVKRGNVNKGDIVKVRARLTINERDLWPEIVTATKAWADKFGYVLDSVVPKIEEGFTQRKVATTKAKVKGDEEVLTEFAERRNIDEPLVKTALFLMKKS